ncbi:MAG: leucine-rich repeat protein [Clostridiales bacterium]|nr:leucine-rich repeat protein [Clostridiales bacterium]
MKRVWALTLVMALCLGILPLAPVAVINEDYEYEILSDGTAEITGYNGFGGGIVIPDTLDGYVVTSIGAWAFSFCGSLTDVTIPDSVTSIGPWAFYGCIILTGVTIPSGVTYIEAGVFCFCFSLTNVTIPPAVTRIERNAFFDSGLKSVIIPSGVTYIGESAFFGCENVYFLGALPAWDAYLEYEPDTGRWIGGPFETNVTLHYPAHLASQWAPNGETEIVLIDKKTPGQHYFYAYPIASYSVTPGDADCSGVVTAADAAAILRYLVQLRPLSVLGRLNAKVTAGTNPVSAADAAKILRFLVQLEKSLEP